MTPKKKTKKTNRTKLKRFEADISYDCAQDKVKTVRVKLGGIEELYEGIPMLKLFVGNDKKIVTLIPLMSVRKIRTQLIKFKEVENHDGGMYG